MSGFDMLGATYEIIGADAGAAGAAGGGFYGGILQAAGELGKGGIEMYQQHEASEKASSDDRAKLSTAIAADSAASIANAAALSSAALAASAPAGKKDAAGAKAAADAAAADIASAAQDRAGAAMPANVTDQRVAAAQTALNAAIVKLQSAPSNTYNQALVKAWTATMNKAQNIQIVKKDAAGSGGGKSWWTRPVLGPIPGWGVAAGGAGLLTGLALILRKVFAR